MKALSGLPVERRADSLEAFATIGHGMPARAFGHIVPRRAGVAGPSHGKRRPLFDRFAEATARVTGAAWFFIACIVSVVMWAAVGPIAGYSDTWQLVINTATTIVTFLLVALLQHSARRSDRALHEKLNAIADALADFMEKAPYKLEKDVAELKAAVGLEERAQAK
jgi:low affinity Fe/Cu permease